MAIMYMHINKNLIKHQLENVKFLANSSQCALKCNSLCSNWDNGAYVI